MADIRTAAERITINTHSSIRIAGEKTLWADPFRVTEPVHDADIILVTHEHYDHFDPDSIANVRRPETVFAAPAGMRKDLDPIAGESQVIYLQPGEEADSGSVHIRALPAYNRIKPFHRKANKWLGYLLTMEGVTYYIAGDTDPVKELLDIKCDIALVPIGGTYTMDAAEAAKLINQIRPQAVIPTHYGSVAGKPQDADRFRSLVDPGIEVIGKLVF